MTPAGWDTGDQIRFHKLAASIINGHLDPTNEVLDAPALALLQRFCADPSTTNRDAILANRGWVDEPGQAPGTKAAGPGQGSLVGLCVARHGTDDAVFDARDIQMLQRWFERSMPSGEHAVR